MRIVLLTGKSPPEHMTRGEATVQCIEGKSSSWTATAPSACTPVTSYTWRACSCAPYGSTGCLAAGDAVSAAGVTRVISPFKTLH